MLVFLVEITQIIHTALPYYPPAENSISGRFVASTVGVNTYFKFSFSGFNFVLICITFSFFTIRTYLLSQFCRSINIISSINKVINIIHYLAFPEI